MYNNKVDIITNPSLIIEVLSPSTEKYDRTAKFKYYRELPSFKEYILISTELPSIETFYKQTENDWYIDYAIGLDSEFHLKSIDCTIQMADIYKKVKDLEEPQMFLDI